MKVRIRKIGNSLGVLIPAQSLRAWKVSEGDTLELTEAGIRPHMSRENAQVRMDRVKRNIAIEVVRRFPVSEIRARSLQNIARWKKAGAWVSAYEEWRALMENGDDAAVLATLVGQDERSNRLRQSMPFVGMLPEELSRRLREETTA
jgi:antitoxin component of MazEF toxin-antitoxin module